MLAQPEAFAKASPVYDEETRVVRKRHVFFVPGYDPIVPRRYRELYRREAAKQATISDYQIQVEGQKDRGRNYKWATVAKVDGVQTETTIEFLTWDDIVKNSMNRSILSAYLVMIRTVWIYFSSGAFFRLVRVRPHPMLAALYPVFVLVGQLLLATGLMAGIWWLLASVLQLPHLIGAACGVTALCCLMKLFYRYDKYVFAYYLINDYGFTARNSGRYPQALRERISEFAARIQKQVSDDVDEVLVVGHSSGAHVAVTALAEAMRSRKDAPAEPAVSFLSLGQVIPMMSFLPKAQELRRDLNYLSSNNDLTWIDVSAPGDGGCFALSDPVHVTGVAPEERHKHWPKVISAAYTETLSPETLAATKWRFFRRHIQYLCAFERPGCYDYFKITAGPLTLKDRFAWRGATASRIETSLSPYRDY